MNISKLKSKNIYEMYIVPTLKCNLNCKYCYVKQKNQTMTFDTAKKAVNLFLDIKGKKKRIIYFGGEPLVEEELLVQIIDYVKKKAKKRNKSIQQIIETNGTLLDNKFLDYIEKNNIDLNISHDGISNDKYRKDKNNKGSKDKIEKTIDLIKKYPKTYNNLLITITTTGDNLYKNLLYLYKKELRKFCISIVLEWIKKEDINRINKDILLIKEFSKKKQNFSVYNIGILSNKERKSKKEDIKTTSKLVCSIDEKILIRPDGTIVPCRSFINSNNPIHILGNIKERKIKDEFFFEGKENEKIKFCMYFNEKDGKAWNFKELRKMISISSSLIENIDKD